LGRYVKKKKNWGFTVVLNRRTLRDKILARGEFSRDFYEPNSFCEKAALLNVPDAASLHKHCRQSYYTGGVHPSGEAAAQQHPPKSKF
jgi:hypothetical protein